MAFRACVEGMGGWVEVIKSDVLEGNAIPNVESIGMHERVRHNDEGGGWCCRWEREGRCGVFIGYNSSHAAQQAKLSQVSKRF